MSTPCPKPEKRAYRTQLQAIAAALGSSRTYGGAGMRAYRCRCGAWHVTHRVAQWSSRARNDGGGTR